ncbi:MAG: hypothetical protein K8H88_00415, partial [Sandaracinaceae bacterium]|nr:hypothetical protein [Sandaracinaceae bacterium]
MAAFCLLLSIAYHLQLRLSGVVAIETLTTLLNREIQGELAIGEISNIRIDKIVARSVVVRDPQGREVIRVGRLTATPDWSALLADGTIRFSRARARSGEVRLYVSGDDEDSVSIVDAFTPIPRPGAGPAARPPHIVVDGIVLDDMTVRGDVPGLDGLRFEEVRVDGRIETRDDVLFQFFDGRAQMTGPFAGRTHVDRIVGRFSTDMRRGLDVYTRANRGEDRVRARARVTRPVEGEPPVLD